MKINPGLIGIVVIAGLLLALVKSCADVEIAQSDNEVLRSDNTIQGQVIATQAFNFSRFNQIAMQASGLNSLVDLRSEETIIKYREIIHREKTCDLPVPTDIASGLLEYAHRLRSSAMHTDSGKFNAADYSTIASSSMTYCQAVLWLGPLLAAIEKANNQLLAINEMELKR